VSQPTVRSDPQPGLRHSGIFESFVQPVSDRAHQETPLAVPMMPAG
jgi:hypothetical protein